MIPSDSEEMEASSFQLRELVDKLYGTGFCDGTDVRNMMGLIGGWAVHFTINDIWKERFGREYLQSRDIDAFFRCDGERLKALGPLLMELGYRPHSNNRYLKILSRFPQSRPGPKYRPVNEGEASKIPSPYLIYHYVDLFCGDVCAEPAGICGKFHSWKMDRLSDVYMTAKALRTFSHPIVIPDLFILLGLKADMIVSHDRNAEKRVKDMCDFIALTYHPDFENLRDRNAEPGRLGHLVEAVKWISGSSDKLLVSTHLYKDEGVHIIDARLEEIITILT